MDDKIRKRIIQARVKLILDHPFWGVLASRFILIENSNMPVQTMGTDGKSLYYDPQWVASLTQAELIGIIAHETSHCAFNHPWRLGQREPRRANLAMDFAIDPILIDAGFALPSAGPTMPHGHIDPRFRNMSFEQIYDLLPTQPPSGGAGCIPPGMTGQVQSPDPKSGGVETLQSDWQVATLQAAQAAKMMGKLPAGLERLIDAIKHPRVDWKPLLRRFVQMCAHSDYSWRQPAKRYIAVGLYLPSVQSEQMPPIVIGVDTSGSIDQETLNQFAAEMQSIVNEVAPERVHVVYCDSKVQRVDEFECHETIVVRPKGGGGTDMGRILEYVDQQEINPACTVVLTDMYTPFPSQAPSYPVLWVATTDVRGPFGETIRIQ